jgi:5-formyltetrahydrofolate cyclo-ligase
MNTRNELRKKTRQRRNLMTMEGQLTASLQLTVKLCSHAKIHSAQHIALYLANDGELDPVNFIHWCWQQGKDIYLPVIHPFSPGNLLFINYHASSVMVKNKYGILEPKLDVRYVRHVNEIDVMCTPLVAFEKSGARLGMGGGFYDRTLAAWHQRYHIQGQVTAKPYPIGLAHDCQLVNSIPSELWDIPLPEIITPLKKYQ